MNCDVIDRAVVAGIMPTFISLPHPATLVRLLLPQSNKSWRMVVVPASLSVMLTTHCLRALQMSVVWISRLTE
jgi:hypothetical protein